MKVLHSCTAGGGGVGAKEEACREEGGAEL